MDLEVPTEAECPYCGNSFTVFIDTSLPSQEYTEDCQVCCKPIIFSVTAKPGRVISIAFSPE